MRGLRSPTGSIMTTATATRLDTFLNWTLDLKLREIRVLAAIDLEADAPGEWVEIRLSKLVDMTGLTTPVVAAALSALEEQGYIEVRREYRDGFGGGKLPNEYRVRWDRE